MKNLICISLIVICFPICLSQFGLDANTIRQLPPKTIALFLADFLSKQPRLLYGLADIGLAALPLLTGQPALKPEIGNQLIPWALENIPKFLKKEEVIKFVQTLKGEMNKVNVSGLNQSNYNEIMDTVLSKTDILKVLISTNPDTIASLLMSVAGPYLTNLNPRITGHLIPWVAKKVPELLMRTLPNILHIFIDELNKINVTEFNMTDNDVFVGQLVQNFDILHFIQTFITQNPVREYFPKTSTTASLGLKDSCYYHTMGFIDNLLNGAKWATKMLDAAGKPPTGILTGNLHFIGRYDECMAVKGNISFDGINDNATATISQTFGGKYCRATFKLPESLVTSLIGKVDTHGIPTTLTWGLCLPDSCGKDDMRGLLHLGILDNFDLNPVSVVCSQDYTLADDKPAIVILSVMLAIVLVVILCTVTQVFIQRKKSEMLKQQQPNVVFLNNAYVSDEDKVNGIPPKPLVVHENGKEVDVDKSTNTNELSNGTHVQVQEERGIGEEEYDEEKPGFARRLVEAFSFRANMSQIMSVDTPPDSIECIYGVRFFSMVMIILGNSYIYNVLSLSDSPVSANLLAALDMLKRVSFQIVLAGSFDTDTFLMISGCLITFRLIAKVEKMGKFRVQTWLGFYLHRYWRITPVYMIIMMAFSCLYYYIGNGPLWPENITVGDKCKTTWWHNILYINNLVDADGLDAYHQCMPWSWQLAVVMQFYLITPILIIFFLLSKYLGSIIVILLMLAGITSAGFKEHKYGGDLMSMSSDGGAYWNNVFIKPWCRVGAYCVGVLLGFLLTIKKDNRTCNKLVAAIGWTLALVTGCTFIFVTYTKNREDGIPWTSVQQAVYESVGRPAWAACIAWVVFACYTGVGGWVNSFMSWRGFIPLSRLTYVVYLIHPVMLVLYVYSKRTLVYLSDYDMIYLFFGHLLISYLAAIPIAAAFEYPFLNLERAIKKRKKS